MKKYDTCWKRGTTTTDGKCKLQIVWVSDDHQDTSDKPACLIIGLLLDLFLIQYLSNSIKTKQIPRRQCCLPARQPNMALAIVYNVKQKAFSNVVICIYAEIYVWDEVKSQIPNSWVTFELKSITQYMAAVKYSTCPISFPQFHIWDFWKHNSKNTRFLLLLLQLLLHQKKQAKTLTTCYSH